MAYITLNKKHFFNNLDIIAQRSKGKDKIALVLKDNAYGHGLKEIATMAREYGITKAVVRFEKEAEDIVEFFDYILVLADKPSIKNDKIRYTINDCSSIKNFISGSKVELKIDTGMGRNGILPKELPEAFFLIKEQGLQLESIFTHHSSADEDPDIFAQQENRFYLLRQEAVLLAKKFGFTPLRFHSCNSAALFVTENFIEDMARVGIAAYGCLELPQASLADQLKPVLSLYAKRNSTRLVEKGESVGYGATFKAEDSVIVSNYDFGYGDGFFRICSNNYTTPTGAKLLGRISMDNSSFTSSEESLLIFDDARKMAASARTISYEVLTALKPYLERIIVN
jgi:alanine racemase